VDKSVFLWITFLPVDKLSTGLADLSTEMADLSTKLSTGYFTVFWRIGS